MTTPGSVSRSRILALVLVAALSSAACTTNPGRLDIYFVDVEGGQATLVVTPTGDTLLIDAGYPGQGKSDPTPGDAKRARDAQRIAAAAADANVSGKWGTVTLIPLKLGPLSPLKASAIAN